MLSGIVRPKSFPALPAGWTAQGSTWTSGIDGVQLFETAFRNAQQPPKRILAIIHGGGEHGGRYQHFAHFLKDRFDAVLAMDHRGHGRSHGTRGYVRHFDDFVDDAAGWLDRMAASFPTAEIHVFAHSLGGLIGLRMLQKHPNLVAKTWVISAPLLELTMPVPAVKRWVGNGLSKIWPDLQLPAGIPADKLSRDPDLLRAHSEDHLIHDKATPRYYTEFVRTAAGLRNWHGPVDRPLLFLLPSADGVVSFPAAQAFAEGLKARSKSIEVLEGFFHESFNDVGKEAVFEKMNRFWSSN